MLVWDSNNKTALYKILQWLWVSEFELLYDLWCFSSRVWMGETCISSGLSTKLLKSLYVTVIILMIPLNLRTTTCLGNDSKKLSPRPILCLRRARVQHFRQPLKAAQRQCCWLLWFSPRCAPAPAPAPGWLAHTEEEKLLTSFNLEERPVTRAKGELSSSFVSKVDKPFGKMVEFFPRTITAAEWTLRYPWAPSSRGEPFFV